MRTKHARGFGYTRGHTKSDTALVILSALKSAPKLRGKHGSTPVYQKWHILFSAPERS